MTSSASEAPSTSADSVCTADRSPSVGLLVLRLVVGIVLLVHGIQNGSDPAGHIAGAREMGVPLAPVTGTLSLLGEVGLGALLLVGLLTRVAGALAAVLMVVTWLFSIAPDGLFTSEPGINSEQALLLMAGGVAVAFLGGGRFALDRIALEPLRGLVGRSRSSTG